MAQGESGRMHMAIECHSCFTWLLPALDRYRDRWPGVELDLASGFAFEPLPALAAGELDLVVTSDPAPLEGVDYVPLFRYEALLALAKDHALAARAWIAPEDLAGETLITYPVERSRLDVYTRFLAPAGVAPKAERRAELTLMMLQLVASGRGVAALPNWALAEYLERDYVVARRLGPEGLWCTLYAAVREETRDAPYMAGFLETARAVCFDTLRGVLAVE
jgi:LysR family transcriptional regulator for metE and metH